MSGLGAEPERELLDQGLRGTDAWPYLGSRFLGGHRESHRQHTGVSREASAPRRMIVLGDEGLELGALQLASAVGPRGDDSRHLGRNHMPVRVERNQEAAPLQGESDPAPGLGRAGGGAQTERLALELEQLVGVDLAALLLDGVEQLALARWELVHFGAERGLLAEGLPGHLEPEHDRRRCRSPEVMGGDRVLGLECGLREQRAHRPRRFSLPRPQLQQVGDRQQQLEVALLATREHHAAGEQRLESDR